jgi:hypothetical protein
VDQSCFCARLLAISMTISVHFLGYCCPPSAIPTGFSASWSEEDFLTAENALRTVTLSTGDGRPAVLSTLFCDKVAANCANFYFETSITQSYLSGFFSHYNYVSLRIPKVLYGVNGLESGAFLAPNA